MIQPYKKPCARFERTVFSSSAVVEQTHQGDAEEGAREGADDDPQKHFLPPVQIMTLFIRSVWHNGTNTPKGADYLCEPFTSMF